MPPARQPELQAPARRLFALRRGAAIAAVLALAWSAMAAAQDGTAPGVDTRETRAGEPLAKRPQEGAPAPPPGPGTNAQGERRVAFEASQVDYDSDADTVTASGDVVLRSEDQSVRADSVSWSRVSGQIVATGNVRLVDEDGNQLFTDRLELTDELKAGAMTNLLLVLREGGRLAAVIGTRDEAGNVVLTRAAYSGCEVETASGCPKTPSWRITAERVEYDQAIKKIRFRSAWFELFGTRVLPLPALSLAVGGQANSGVGIPDLGYSRSNGFELSDSYYWRIADNRDLVLSGYLYSKTAPMASAQYRALTDNGAYQITGYFTYGKRIPLGSTLPVSEKDWRGYFDANGRFQLDPHWSITASARIASDRTFLRRYDVSRDDRLRSMVDVERIDADSYFSIAGWATQVLLTDQKQGLVPIALPEIDYRRRFDDPLLGGKLELQVNSLALTRTAGQDTQRAFARAQWDLRRVTAWGQEITLTALVRGDVYHSDENAATVTPLYRGDPGWQARGIAIAAIDAKWPLVGGLLGGTQVLTPRVQVVASPPIRNLEVPNEDARSIDLEDSNLFALNRFPGYDRIEDGVRVTYGADWELDRPGWRVRTTIGQSYRLSDKPALFPDGTGLQGRFSDWVGRTEVRFRDFIKFTHRFRLDKDNFAVRRNEIDATVGSDRSYIEVGYLRLNRNIDLSFEDLQDREELRAAGRLAFAKYWSVFGSAVVNLTDKKEDPTNTSDGFDPLRTRFGIAYSDDCLEFGVTWRRDYVRIADARLGNNFQLFFSLKNLGFR
uniref:LPS-assembly protein LptD n=1 Tax=Altererythrobacter segetis TaxID=1104773 RepID=UPI0014094DF2|nr:LPS assembly protein LptD [Altererythrobacter segetis]